MARNTKALSDSQIKKLAPTWRVKKKQLYKKFIFSNFSDALGFIVQIGVEAERSQLKGLWLFDWKRSVLGLKVHARDT